MSTSLTNNSIASTYQGILHAEGAPIPQSSKKRIYDGAGNATALFLGRTGQGASIESLSASNFVANGITFPQAPKSQYNVVVQSTAASNGTAVTGLSSIPAILKASNIGLSYVSYEDLNGSSKVPFYKTVNGLTTAVATKEITAITEAAGGKNRSGAPVDSSNQFVRDIDIAGGIVTKVHYGDLQTTVASRRQVRTFFFDLRLDPDNPIDKTTKAGRYYDEPAVTAYVNSVWNMSHETQPITGDIAIVIAVKTANQFKAVATDGGVASISVTQTGLKSWGYRWTGSEWDLIGSREIEPGDDPTSWLNTSPPQSSEDNWPLS